MNARNDLQNRRRDREITATKDQTASVATRADERAVAAPVVIAAHYAGS